MLLKTILMLFATATIVWCQTPPGFEPSTAHKLDVKFKKNVVVQPGNEIEMAGKYRDQEAELYGKVREKI